MRKLLLLFLCASLCGSGKHEALYHSLDPQSVAQALAFYELHPESELGKAALHRAATLIGCELQAAASLASCIDRKDERLDLDLIERLAAHFPNRRLKGFAATCEKEAIALPSHEIDLGRALVLSQLDDAAEARKYSAMLDLMALQIEARLPTLPSVEEKIDEMNRFIFDEMHFRFPPQSIYAEEIDRYTFLSSVMDDHLGVCLGVTGLYLAIAQRLDLPLEIVTPPGHIYTRYRDGEKIINIETTARGIDVPCEAYLSLSTSCLQTRALKEVVGMNHVNQASVYLHEGHYAKAACSYEKALPYMEGDPLLAHLLGFSYILLGQEERGMELLHRDACGGMTASMAADFLAGEVNKAGLEALFLRVDETRDSICEKRDELTRILRKFPKFRDGWHQLATCHLQLRKHRAAIGALLAYHELDASNPVVEYYLSVLYGMQRNFPKCWEFLKRAEILTEHYHPKALQELRRELVRHAPEPLD